MRKINIEQKILSHVFTIRSFWWRNDVKDEGEHCTSDTNRLLSHLDSTHLCQHGSPIRVTVPGTQAVELSFPRHRAPSDNNIHLPEYGTHC